MKSSSCKVLLASAPLIAAALVPFLSTGCKKHAPAAERPAPEVLVMAAESKNVPVIRNWIGSVQGAQNAQIEARVSGYLMSQEYREGSLVKAGQVLFRIDPRPFEAALAQAQANLSQMQAKAQLSAITLKRQTELFKTKVISAEEFDVSTQTAAADVAAAQAAAAAVEEAKLNLEFCTVLSPFDGIAGKATAQIGDLVGPGNASILTTVSQVNPVKVNFFLSEQEYLRASPMIEDMERLPEINERPRIFEIQLANGDVYPQKGVFDFVNREVDPRTGTIEVVSLFPNPTYILRPGQYANVSVLVETLEDAVVVPQRALNELQGTYYQIAVVGADNTVQIRTVTPGIRYGSDWVISEGLKAGESIVVEGGQKLQNGTRVVPKPFVEPPEPPEPQASPSPQPEHIPPVSTPTPASLPDESPAPAPSASPAATK